MKECGELESQFRKNEIACRVGLEELEIYYGPAVWPKIVADGYMLAVMQAQPSDTWAGSGSTGEGFKNLIMTLRK